MAHHRVTVIGMTGELRIIAEVAAASGPSTVDILLQVAAAVAVVAPPILIAKLVLWSQTPAAAGERAPRRGRTPLPAAPPTAAGPKGDGEVEA